jgi:hypothetical protein
MLVLLPMGGWVTAPCCQLAALLLLLLLVLRQLLWLGAACREWWDLQLG